ncbi:uncharacterized protein LOC144266887 [Eretmochelys imbricata]
MRRFPWGHWAAFLISAIQATLASAQGAERGGGPSEEHVTNAAVPLIYFGSVLVIALLVAVCVVNSTNSQSHGNRSQNPPPHSNRSVNSDPPRDSSSSGNSQVRNRKKNSQAERKLEKETTEEEKAAAAAVVYLIWQEIRKPVDALVKRIIAEVSKSHNLFTGEAILVGSRAQDLHVQAQSCSLDYDFLVPIHYNTNLILTSCQFCKLDTQKGCLPVCRSSKTPVPANLCGDKVMVHQTPEPENSLCPHYVMTEFCRCVQEALADDPFGREQEQWQDRDVSTSQSERRKFVPGVSNVKLRDMNNKPKCSAVQLSAEVNGRPVSIDLVPTIRNKVEVSKDWLKLDLSWLSDWWDWEQGAKQRKPTWNITEIDKTGTDLVAKGSFWRLTFSLAETQLLKDIDADGGCRWLALRQLKKINMKQWIPRYGKVLTSYHLKTVLFWASYLNPETENWATELDALGTLLKLLEFSLEKRHLPSYFLHSVNLFDWCLTEEENSLKNRVLEVLRWEVRLTRCSPEPYLQLTDKPEVLGPFI